MDGAGGEGGDERGRQGEVGTVERHRIDPQD
jgi:hypothetical protein